MSVWEEIVDYTVPSNTASVVLSNFGTITKDDFIKINISTPNNASGFMKLLANNSSATDYYGQTLFANNTSLTSSRQNDNRLNASSDEGNTFITCKLSENNVFNIFSNQTRTTQDPLVAFNYTTSTNSTFPNGITSFTITQPTLGAGSRIQIYRLTAEKVADITVASNTTQVDITGLDIQKGSEYLLVSDQIANNGDARTKIYVNNNLSDSGYYSQRIIGSGSSAGARRFSYPRFYYVDNGTLNVSYTHIKLSNIGAFTYQNYGLIKYGSSSLYLENAFGSSTSESLTSLNTITIKSDQSNAISSNSRFQLYKLY